MAFTSGECSENANYIRFVFVSRFVVSEYVSRRSWILGEEIRDAASEELGDPVEIFFFRNLAFVDRCHF